MELYVITGFLGAGKTTFLKEFLKRFPQKKIGFIVNEFGREGVDGELLRGLGNLLTEISGGSVFCSCRLDQFEEALADMVAQEPDVILIEASGLSDPGSIRAILERDARFAAILYRGSLCLIDALRFEKVFRTAVVCRKQVAAADVAILNKCDQADAEALQKTRDLLQAQQPGLPVLETSYGRIPEEWAPRLLRPALIARPEADNRRDIAQQKYTITLREGYTEERLRKFLSMFALESHRVKGFVLLENRPFLVDCVGGSISIEPYDHPVAPDKLQKLTALSGGGLPLRKSLRQAAAWYSDFVEGVE